MVGLLQADFLLHNLEGTNRRVGCGKKVNQGLTHGLWSVSVGCRFNCLSLEWWMAWFLIYDKKSQAHSFFMYWIISQTHTWSTYLVLTGQGKYCLSFVIRIFILSQKKKRKLIVIVELISMGIGHHFTKA